MAGPTRIFKYPLENQTEYEGRIVFYLVNEEAERPSTPDFDKLLGGVWEGYKSIGQAASDIYSTLKDRGIDISNAKASFYGRGNDSKNYVVSKDPQYLPNQKVTLFLPQAVQVQDAASYDANVELGALGGGMERSILQGNNIGAAFASGIEQSSRVIQGILGGNVNLSAEQASVASAKVASKAPIIGSEAASAAVTSATGITTNPNTRALFKSVPIRQFSFSYTLIPTSAQEAEQIRNIVKFFRSELYPEALRAGGLDYGYKFPNRFLIKLQYRNKDIPGVKFLPAYLQSFTTNYNPNGMGMHRDGNWSEVQITMNFTEGKALARQDVVEGGY